jgi:hypothetical protein
VWARVGLVWSGPPAGGYVASGAANACPASVCCRPRKPKPANGSWTAFTTPLGARPVYAEFRKFIETDPDQGIGVPVDTLKAMIKSDPDLHKRVEALLTSCGQPTGRESACPTT